MSTYVYGITTRSHPALPEGLDGVGDPPRPVRVLKEGELAAVVSDAPEDLRPKRRELLAHQNVLAETGATGCVLPMRFGSVAPDDSKVTEILAERASHYEERLRALDGKVEYNLKASHVEEEVLRQVLADDPELRALADANRQAGWRQPRAAAPARRDDRRRRTGTGGPGRGSRAGSPRAPRRGDQSRPRIDRMAGQHLLPGGTGLGHAASWRRWRSCAR